jgi:molybdopterin/thiamine biosynthesis adenylyltransferase
MKPWYESNIQRYEKELNDLQALNVFYEIDEEAKQFNILRISLKIDGKNPHFDLPDKSKTFELVAVYPDTYPYFRPNVFGYNFQLIRHHDPINQGLCLLERDTASWLPETTLAEHLRLQLKKVIIQGNETNQAVLAQDPSEQAEPISEYFPFWKNAPILFDPSAVVYTDDPDLEIQKIGRIKVGFPKGVLFPTRAAVLQIDNSNGSSKDVPEILQQMYPLNVYGSLFRLKHPPSFADAAKDLQWLIDSLRNVADRLHFNRGSVSMKDEHGNKYEIKNVIGFNFPEETAPLQKQMTGWLFLIVVDKAIKRTKSNTIYFESFKHGAYYAKVSRINTGVNIRIPKLHSLANKVVAVFGLGALGAPSANEFARNGVSELRLIDHDIVDTATTVRWPFGFSYAGMAKTQAIKNFIDTNYPVTSVRAFKFKIGDSRLSGKGIPPEVSPFELPLINEILDGVDLIYDATAEEGVSHFLAEEARRRKVPLVSISATQGAVGGRVLRVDPNRTEGCWMCHMWWRTEKDKKDKFINPPEDKDGKIQHIGCGDITFTGAGFDLQLVSLAGVRMAVSNLCNGTNDAYPWLNWDYAILSLVDENGNAISPRWEEYKLMKHPHCEYCNPK